MPIQQWIVIHVKKPEGLPAGTRTTMSILWDWKSSPKWKSQKRDASHNGERKNNTAAFRLLLARRFRLISVAHECATDSLDSQLHSKQEARVVLPRPLVQNQASTTQVTWCACVWMSCPCSSKASVRWNVNAQMGEKIQSRCACSNVRETRWQCAISPEL